MIRCVGFDLDNTLYDQRQHIINVAQAADEWLCLDAGTESGHVRKLILNVWDMLGPSHPTLFDEILRQLGLHTKERVAILVELYHARTEPLTTFPGIRALLQRLAHRGPLFLVSDGNAKMQRRKLQSLGIAPFFDTIVLTSECGASKPSPEPFRHIVRQLRIPAQCMLYVGDNPTCDIAGASQVGMKTARVLTGPFRSVSNGDYTATYTLSNARELEQLFVNEP
jgi:HAD superfamily hydrolase (TIGR01549 family)